VGDGKHLEEGLCILYSLSVIGFLFTGGRAYALTVARVRSSRTSEDKWKRRVNTSE